QAEEDVGVDHRLLERAGLGLDRIGRLPLVHAVGAALIDHPLGVAQDQVLRREADGLQQFQAGDPGGAGSVADEPCGLDVALGQVEGDVKTTRLVCNGAGAAGIACLELLKAVGFAPENLILCDTKGVIYQGRTDGMNQWKSGYAVKTKARTLEQALIDADVFFGLSAKGAVTQDMVKMMAPSPIIFAMANPDPEITVEEVAAVRDDAIMATGRSDYPNQINNVLGFPYIFRGALDVRASAINMEMKIAAAR